MKMSPKKERKSFEEQLYEDVSTIAKKYFELVKVDLYNSNGYFSVFVMDLSLDYGLINEFDKELHKTIGYIVRIIREVNGFIIRCKT